MILLLCLISTVSAGAWYIFKSGREGDPSKKSIITSIMEMDETPENLNVLFAGVDKDGTHTDTMVLGMFDFKNKKMAMVSFPRDTRIKLSPEKVQKLREKYDLVPRSGVMKLNGIYHSTYPDGMPYLKEYIAELAGVEVHHYIKVNINGFRRIINEIGGVDFEVPMDMNYDDPTQDLHIQLKQGRQRLDGDKAEQLVRFRHDNQNRGYVDGDIGRIKTQQGFIKAAIKQVFSPMNILNPFKVKSLLKILEEETDTDFNWLQDGIRYSNALKGMKKEEVITEKIPGEDKYIGEASYYIADEEKTKELIRRLMYTTEEQEEDLKEGEEIQPEDLKVELLNGTYIAGLAKAAEDYLSAQGYQVLRVDNYHKKEIQKTIIQTSNKKLGEKLKKVLKSGEISSVIDEDVPTGRIRIVLGEDLKYLKEETR